MIHAYIGDGKGKTTAAFGLALRALGHGQRVHVCQFCKDGSSGEVKALLGLSGASAVADTPPVLFSSLMDAAQRAAARREHDEHLSQAAAMAREHQVDLLVLDEVLTAYELGLLDKDRLRDLVECMRGRTDMPELVLTGRVAPQIVLDSADYVTRMDAVRHPFTQGVGAREGVEY